MKTVLAILGSPRRKGDTYRTVSIIEEKLKERGDVDFKYIYLSELMLEYCRGCLLCMRKGEDACPVKDGAADLRKELLAADGIIFSSPVYEHHVSALMKNFFDRFVYFIHRPAFHGKPAMAITSTEISGNEETLAYLRFCAEAWGFTIVKSIGIIADGMKIDGPYRARLLKQIECGADDFVRVMEGRPLPKPTMRSLQFFNKLRTKVIIHRGKLPYDYLYWKEKGWLEKNYFYETKIGFFSRVLAMAPVVFIILAMKLKLGGELFRTLFLEPMRTHSLAFKKGVQS